MTSKLKQSDWGAERGRQHAITVKATFFWNETLQRRRGKKPNNRGKRYSAAEAESGSEHVFTASVNCWCQNIRESWNEMKEGSEERERLNKP